MCLVGKRVGRGMVAATAPEGQPGRLAQLVDEATKQRYLVDSGSAFSIRPFRSSSKPTGPGLATATGTPIRCWGRQRAAIRAGGRSFSCNLLMADVSFPILGADFLGQHRMMVDLAAMQLVDKQGWRIQLATAPRVPLMTTIGVQD